MRFAWPLTGRTAEMQTIEGAMAVPITDREREIVMFLAQGSSGRAIADRLTLSVRTAEGHIYRAMGKTSAADHDELARMIPGQATGT